MRTICFDFDGVIHSYASGWKGASVIPDKPVNGIRELIAELREKGIRIVVVSSRCNSPGGKEATESWLNENGITVDEVTNERPDCIANIDDRGIPFTENLYHDIVTFVPWNKTYSPKHGTIVFEHITKEMRPVIQKLQEDGYKIVITSDEAERELEEAELKAEIRSGKPPALVYVGNNILFTGNIESVRKEIYSRLA